MTTVEINGVRLHVEAEGSGPTALVLHGGLGIDHQPYRSLGPLAGRLRLVYYDHRGNGRSDVGDRAAMTMQQWADDAAALARIMGGGDPVVLIGHSFGGFIAQEAAIRYRDVVRGMVLLDTTPGQLGDGEQPSPDGPLMPARVAALLERLPDNDDEFADMMAQLAPAYLHRLDGEVLRRQMGDVVFRVDAMHRGFEELARWSSVDRLAGIACPVLCIVGRHDVFTSWPQSQRIASRLSDSELTIFEHSGHFPWLEEPDLVFGTINDWLDRHDIA